jgi:hypothetical protein
MQAPSILDVGLSTSRITGGFSRIQENKPFVDLWTSRGHGGVEFNLFETFVGLSITIIRRVGVYDLIGTGALYAPSRQHQGRECEGDNAVDNRKIDVRICAMRLLAKRR